MLHLAEATKAQDSLPMIDAVMQLQCAVQQLDGAAHAAVHLHHIHH